MSIGGNEVIMENPEPQFSTCMGAPGATICWDLTTPIGYSDGGVVQDKIRKQEVQHKIEQLILAQYPELNYHPIALPESPGDLDPNTISLPHGFFFLFLTRQSLPFKELLALPLIRTLLATGFSFRFYLYYT